MKKSWNGLLALGRSMAGLEGRPREFRMVDDAFPSRLPGEPTTGSVPAAGNPTPESPLSRPERARTGTAGSTPARPEPNPFHTVTPVVPRSRGWRWFGWFRSRPVGSNRPEQIELRLEDVRPLRNSLAGEDFVLMETKTTKPARFGRNPFSDAPKAVTTAAPAVEPKGFNRLTRWFRGRETTALK